MRRGLPPNNLTLRHFLLKAEVLSVYRQVVRTCRCEHPGCYIVYKTRLKHEGGSNP